MIPNNLLCEAVRAHGIVQPPLVDGNMRVVCGALLVKVVRHLGYNRMPILRSETLTDDELRLYAVRMSRIAKYSQYDEALLALELRELEQLLEIPSFLDLGFEQGELDRIFKFNEMDLGLDVDEAPELEERFTIAQPGDCWILEGHRLLCGDALDVENSVALWLGCWPVSSSATFPTIWRRRRSLEADASNTTISKWPTARCRLVNSRAS